MSPLSLERAAAWLLLLCCACSDDSPPGTRGEPEPDASAPPVADGAPPPPPTPAPGDAAPPSGFGRALRFSGNGTGDIDRVKIRIDQPGQTSGSWPVDVGATDFTIEWWLSGTLADNPAPAVGCGGNNEWIRGNIVVDRDRFNQPRKFGVSLGAGRVVFGVTGESNGADVTLCWMRGVLDGAWHHVAVQRRRSDGRMWIFVDGALDAEGDGPDGDVSYPDGAQPGAFCDGPCTQSDPFLVLGAEKHDADPVAYPAFRGAFDELRVSRVLRYAGSFTRPATPFVPDAETAGLYHFDEGQGTVAGDSSGAPGGPSPGEIKVGGSPIGPVWIDGP